MAHARTRPERVRGHPELLFVVGETIYPRLEVRTLP